MKLQQQATDAARDHLIEMIGIGALVMFGVIMLFFGWLKYKDRNRPPRPKTRKSAKRRAKRR